MKNYLHWMNGQFGEGMNGYMNNIHFISVSGELVHCYFNPNCKTAFPSHKKTSVGTQNMIKKEIPFWIKWGMDGIFLGYFLFGFFNAGELQFWFYILNSFFFLKGSNCCGVSRFLSFFRQQRKCTHVSILKLNCQMDLNTCFVETNTYNKNKQSWFCFRSATISMYKFSVVHSPQKSRILYK